MTPLDTLDDASEAILRRASVSWFNDAKPRSRTPGPKVDITVPWERSIVGISVVMETMEPSRGNVLASSKVTEAADLFEIVGDAGEDAGCWKILGEAILGVKLIPAVGFGGVCTPLMRDAACGVIIAR